MTSNLFFTHLVSASYRAVEFARKFVYEPLSYEFLYDVELNQSCDVPYSEPEVQLYSDEQKLSYRHLSKDEVVKLLCRDEYVPVWICIGVKGIFRKNTILELLCSDRYTNQNDPYGFEEKGLGPFTIKGPPLPTPK